MQMPKSVQPAAVGRNGPPSRKASGSKRCGASANIVCGKLAGFAKLISRETGKPLWEARTEVEAAIKKVEISAEAYFERAPLAQEGKRAQLTKCVASQTVRCACRCDAPLMWESGYGGIMRDITGRVPQESRVFGQEKHKITFLSRGGVNGRESALKHPGNRRNASRVFGFGDSRKRKPVEFGGAWRYPKAPSRCGTGN